MSIHYRRFFTDIATEGVFAVDAVCPGGGVAVDLSLCAAFLAAYCVPSSAIYVENKSYKGYTTCTVQSMNNSDYQ